MASRFEVEDHSYMKLLNNLLPELPSHELNKVETPLKFDFKINMNSAATDGPPQSLLDDGSLQVFGQAQVLRGGYIRFRINLETTSSMSTGVPIRLRWKVTLKQNQNRVKCGEKCCFVNIPFPTTRCKSSFLEIAWSNLRPFQLDGTLESKWTLQAEWYRSDRMVEFDDKAKLLFHHIADVLQEHENQLSEDSHHDRRGVLQ